MKTDPLYLIDSYAKEMDATVTEVVPESDGRWRVSLDNTVFYPMGGGQPTDQGELVSGSWKGSVYQVLMKDEDIAHYVQSDTPPAVGTMVHGVINWDRRYKHMRLHSAGHVVDFAMHVLGYSPSPLMPTKGDHGKKPYIVYTGTLDTDIAKQLEDAANDLVAKELPLTTAFVPLEQLEKDAIYLQPGLPANKPLRKLTLVGIGSVADGGTQVANTKEVGHVQITSVVAESGNVIVSYRIDA